MSQPRKQLVGLLAVALCAALPAAASNHSIEVLWEASSGLTPDELQLPYDLFDSADPEDPLLSGGVLTLATSHNAETMGYRQVGAAVMMPDHLIIEARLRYVSGTTSTPARLPLSIAWTTEPTVGNGLWIGKDQMFLLVSNSVPGTSAFVDTDDAFHTYRIEVIGSAITVFYDGVQVLTGNTYSDVSTNGNLERIHFGNASILSQGVSEWQWFKHNAGPPIVSADWNAAFAIQAHGPVLHPSLLVGLQPRFGTPTTAFPDSQTLILQYPGLELNEEIQIDLASYGPPFYPPDPIRVIGADRIEVDMDDNGTMFTLVIDLASSTGELLDPGSVVGFNPQPEPPASASYAFDPAPSSPGGALGIFARLTGGTAGPAAFAHASGASGTTTLSLTIQILDAGNVPLPLSLVSTALGVPGDPGPGPRPLLGRFYPNPFRAGGGHGLIPFHMPSAGHAHLAVFDVTGRLVKVLFDGPAQEGSHHASWDGRDAVGHPSPSGVYYYRLVVDGTTQSSKMVLTRR